ALFLCAIASIALVLSGSFVTLIAIGSVLYVAVYQSGFASLLILRRSGPGSPQAVQGMVVSVEYCARSFGFRRIPPGLGDRRPQTQPVHSRPHPTELYCFDPDRTRER